MRLIVDSHCHAAAFWHEPYETLLHAMDLNGVEHGIIMNMHGFGDVNNAYQQEAVRRHPDRLSSCVCVDEHAPDAPQTLERLAEAGACGVRILAALVQAVLGVPAGIAVQVPPVVLPVGAVLGVDLGLIAVSAHAEPAGVAVPVLPRMVP